MTGLHPFGQHFRYWREKRGYSLKEAAGDIVSPQFLSQFEQGKKGMSVEHLSRLLMSIGVDWSDFLMGYKGERVDYAYHLIGNHPVPGQGAKLREALAPYYHDNPQLKEFFLAGQRGFHTVQELDKMTLPDGVDRYLEAILSQTAPNAIETDLYIMYRYHFPLSYVLDMKNRWITQLDQVLEARDVTGVHNTLLSLATTVYYLSERAYYVEAQKLIDELRVLLKKSANRFYADFFIAIILLDSQQVYLWLRQNRSEALERAREIIALYDQMFAFTGDAYLIERRTNFIRNVNQLNKTGKPLYED